MMPWFLIHIKIGRGIKMADNQLKYPIYNNSNICCISSYKDYYCILIYLTQEILHKILY